jgi:predicted NACHT family NTPase
MIDTLKSPILIVGPAGYGKTSYCRVNTVKDIENITTGKSRRIPIYVPLFRLAQGPIGTFEETFFQTSDLHHFLAESSNDDWSFRLYLDGLDEVPQLERQREILRLVREGKERHPGLQIVMTARDYVIGPHLAEFSRIKLSELNDAQTQALVSKWLNQDEHLISQFFNQLSNIPSLEVLMRAPLLATLIIAVFRNPRLKKLPESKVRLYELFVELHCGGWDAAKNVSRNALYGSTVKLKILTRLAGLVHYARQRDFELHDLKKSIRHTFANLLGEADDVLNDLLQDGLITKAGNKLAFAHLSFQEYLAAKDFSDPTGQKVTQALKWFMSGEDWWREVLGFYVGFSTKPQEIEQWIFDSAKSIGRINVIPAGIFDQPIGFLLKLLETYFPGYRTKHSF